MQSLIPMTAGQPDKVYDAWPEKGFYKTVDGRMGHLALVLGTDLGIL